MRFIGRRRMLSSPVRILRNGWPAHTPASRRSPVPELPESRMVSGSLRSPPWTVSSVAEWASILMPISLSERTVFRQSSEGRKLVICVSPSASAPRMAARWEMDLSPGGATSPRNGFSL